MTKKSDYKPHIAPDKAPRCFVDGCREPGAYKAPASKENLHQYQWFCLDHIREFNKQWDFFDGMNAREIEGFMRDAVTGHRPTWSRESNLKYPHEKLEEALAAFLNPDAIFRKKTSPRLPVKLREALAALDMEYPYTVAALKKQYRALVKKHHPDVNKGTPKSEARFKDITTSYVLLLEHIKTA